MTNLEMAPAEIRCDGTTTPRDEHPAPGDEPRVPDAPEVLEPRDVPLGGVRAMTVRRTLPQRRRSFIGAWCFLDHYGPDDVAVTGGMRVPPHPHTGLQTVSWLFSGEIEHRDSIGTHSLVRPGELNLMTAGHGISHSEDSTPATTVLHGVQLWVVLPEHSRGAPPAFAHHVPPVTRVLGGKLRVFLGSLAGVTSPVPTFSPLLGAELLLDAGATVILDVDPTFEHGVLVDSGELEVEGVRVLPGQLVHLATGRTSVTVRAVGPDPMRGVLIGGEPLGERIVMWWNFIGRDHDEVVAARNQWQAQVAPVASEDGVATVAVAAPGRFGQVLGYPGAPLPAPPIPDQRLLPRG